MEESAQPAVKQKKLSKASAVAKKPQAEKKQQKAKISIAWPLMLLLLIAVTGFFAMVYFDMYGLKGLAASILNLDEAVNSQITQLEQKNTELNNRQAELDALSAELEKDTKQIESREAEVAGKEAKLQAAQLTYEAKLYDISVLTAMMENMDSPKAAAAISGMTNINDIAVLLASMDSGKAALILDNLDPALSAQVLSTMMQLA
jgi:Skp family chaperone for outer membrane proteins